MLLIYFFNNFIYLFLAVLGLCCCVVLVVSRGYSLIAVHGLLITVTSLVAERWL